MSVRALFIVVLGAAACVRPNPLFSQVDDDDDDDDASPGSTGGAVDDSTGSPGDTSEGDAGSSSEAGASTGDTCDDACADPDRACIDGIDCSGDLDWAWRSGDGAPQRASAVTVLSDGSLVVAGSFAGAIGEGTLTASAASDSQESDAFVVRLDPAGQLIWLRTFDGPGQQRITAVDALPGDAIAVAGQFDGVFDTGPVTLQGIGAAPGLVGALTDAGEWIFVEGIGGDAVEVVGVLAGPGDTVTVAGRFSGPFSLGDQQPDSPDLDVFAARFDLAGDVVWSRAVQAAADQRVLALAPAPDGGVVLAGEFTGALAIAGDALSAQGTDGLLLTIGADGLPTSARALGGPDFDAIHALAVAPDGALIIAGIHGAGLDLGDGPLPTLPGPLSGFVAALDPSGALRWARAGLALGAGDPRLVLDDDGRAVALLPVGDATLDLGDGPLGGSGGALLVKLTAAGNPAWSHHIPTDPGTFSAALATGPGGAIGLAGAFDPTLGLAGQSLSSVGDLDVFAAHLRP